MNIVLILAVILLGLALAFVILAVFCSFALSQKSDVQNDEPCQWCVSADDVTCEECKARRGIK